ncbi:MAG: NADH-quinone oxidoreductase subunit NuoK [Candidatus Lokiarchaeota archaeon]|nr:NADH-quinone oxidoreductase subunit NuoK [Candidatus Lokiarchaeota archaeon]
MSWYLILSFMLIGLGVYGMMVKRNLIRVLIGAEIIGNGVTIALIAFALYNTPFTFTGQGLTILIITIAAAHTALAMVLMLMYHRRYGTVDLGQTIHQEETRSV